VTGTRYDAGVTRPRALAAFVTLACALSFVPGVARAQGPAGQTPYPPADPRPGRLSIDVAGGPALEVATAGERASQRGMLAVPSLGIGVTSWFDYVIEGHVAAYLTPETGYVAGVVPVGLRFHSRGRTQAFAALGAGLAWTNLTGLRGIERRRNYLTQVGGGVRWWRTDGTAISLEARLLHLSNLGAAPPNLGIEVFTVLVGYRFSR
jgi:hypothetical protein